jgi:hypothetical protein
MVMIAAEDRNAAPLRCRVGSKPMARDKNRRPAQIADAQMDVSYAQAVGA